MSREAFMCRAIACAKKAAALGEIPVGAVVVLDGNVISTGYNRREKDQNALLHAEMVAIDRACKKIGSWRLSECDLYVTLEPCPMCTGAIINARIRRVFIGTMDPKAGCMGSVCDLTKYPFNHQPEVICGVSEEACRTLLIDFFRDLRSAKKIPQKTVSFRPFLHNDIPVLKQYLYASRSQKSIASLVDQWNQDRSSLSFAVTDGERCVGYVRLTEEEKDLALLDLYIFSDFRGKTYGTQSLQMLLSLSKEKGFSSALVHGQKNSVPALRLLRSAGFSQCGEDFIYVLN